MLEGVWIVVGTAKNFAKQNGDRGVEILDSAPFDATRESVWGGGLGEIPYRPRPIPSGWLTTQVSGYRA